MELEQLENLLDDLCITAELPARPKDVSSFLYHRALGESRFIQAEASGTSERNLRKWEDKISKNLNSREQVLLVEISIEYQRRLKGGNE